MRHACDKEECCHGCNCDDPPQWAEAQSVERTENERQQGKDNAGVESADGEHVGNSGFGECGAGVVVDD